jgi:hypothetical protein
MRKPCGMPILKVESTNLEMGPSMESISALLSIEPVNCDEKS